MKRISDLTPITGERLPSRRWEDILNEDYTLEGWKFMEGKFGEYVLMTLHDETFDERFVVSCGGSIVLDQLKSLDADGEIPITISFVQNGRRVYLA